MILFHGSVVLVKKPELFVGSGFLDFGVGFYTTSSFQQAERWAKIKMRRESKNIGYVSVYKFDIKAAETKTVIRHYPNADLAWLQFIVSNRKGEPVSESVDIHIGPVADDNIYRSIRLFETGTLNADETLKRLKTEVLHDQWAFHTDQALSFIEFIDCKEVRQEV